MHPATLFRPEALNRLQLRDRACAFGAGLRQVCVVVVSTVEVRGAVCGYEAVPGHSRSQSKGLFERTLWSSRPSVADIICKDMVVEDNGVEIQDYVQTEHASGSLVRIFIRTIGGHGDSVLRQRCTSHDWHGTEALQAYIESHGCRCFSDSAPVYHRSQPQRDGP